MGGLVWQSHQSVQQAGQESEGGKFSVKGRHVVSAANLRAERSVTYRLVG